MIELDDPSRRRRLLGFLALSASVILLLGLLFVMPVARTTLAAVR